MNVSVVGCGGISKCHFNALNKIDGVKITSVVDINHKRADEAALMNNCTAYYDFDEMLEKSKPDAVHICTPHYLHVPMSVKALSRGIHVICEKPCAVSHEDLTKLRLAQSMSGVQYGVCFQNRYNNSVRIVKDLIDSNKYGKIISARAFVSWCRNAEYYSDDWHGTLKKECGGVLVNQSIHTQDLLCYLVGKKIRTVDGHISNDHLKGIIEVEDTASARFVFDDGTIGIFYATTGFGVDARIMIDIFCEDGTLRIEGENAYLIEKSGKINELHLSDSTDYVGKTYWGKGHDSLIFDFYDHIKNNKKFPIDAYEGGKSVENFLAIYDSSKSGQTITLIKE